MPTSPRPEPRVRKIATRFDGAELPRVNKISKKNRVKASKTAIIDATSTETTTGIGTKTQTTVKKSSMTRKKGIQIYEL
jgi:hypothetical protein